MPRPRRGLQTSGSLSPHQASYVLNRMMSERRISPGEINRYLSDIQREINDLEQKLEGLRAASGAMRAAAGGGGGAAAAPRRRGRPPGSGVKRGPGRPPGRPPGSAAGAAPGAAAPAKAAARKRTRITPEQLASRQLQGRYLGLIRQIPATRRSQYQRVAKERGREAAIREMQDALKK